MTTTGITEKPTVFECNGSRLIGIFHVPPEPVGTGVITLIAGGPQYRGGVSRGMVSMARDLCAQGVPVLRFDYRGMGDSEGEFVGFEDVADDLQAAADALMAEVPGLQRIVIWGGCDAASGAMIHSWKVPQIHSLVLANPWVYTPKIASAARNQHYLSRLKDPFFWKKVVRLEYNLLEYGQAALKKVAQKLGGLWRRILPSDAVAESTESFVDRMLAGLSRFEGPVLFVLSGQSIVSTEFDELIAREPGWREVYDRETCQRVDLPEADQAFSTSADRKAVNAAIIEWVQQLESDSRNA